MLSGSGAGRTVITDAAPGDGYCSVMASVGIKEGDKFATIELTAHELEGLIDHLNLLLQAMTEQ